MFIIILFYSPLVLSKKNMYNIYIKWLKRIFGKKNKEEISKCVIDCKLKIIYMVNYVLVIFFIEKLLCKWHSDHGQLFQNLFGHFIIAIAHFFGIFDAKSRHFKEINRSIDSTKEFHYVTYNLHIVVLSMDLKYNPPKSKMKCRLIW